MFLWYNNFFFLGGGVCFFELLLCFVKYCGGFLVVVLSDGFMFSTLYSLYFTHDKVCYRETLNCPHQEVCVPRMTTWLIMVSV